MENKSIAYDYLSNFILVNKNADFIAASDTRLSNSDRDELESIMSAIKGLALKAQDADLLYSEQGQKFRDEQLKFQTESFDFLSRNTENTIETIMGVKSALQDVVKGATKAYNYIMAMYIATFVLGIGLIVVSIIFAYQDKALLAIAFGGIGFMELITTFFFKPPTEIQNSRSNLSQLMIIIMNRFAELMNLNGYISAKGGNITLAELKDISNTLDESTKKMVSLIEDFSEIREKHPVNKKK